MAQALKLKPGDRTILVVNTSDGAMNTLDLEVVGIFQSFSKEYDNRAIKIPLAALKNCSIRRARTPWLFPSRRPRTRTASSVP